MSRFFARDLNAQYIAACKMKYTLCGIFFFTLILKPVINTIIMAMEAREDENKKHLYARF
jgi:hypothetical protein